MIFLASTAHCYKEDMKNYGNELAQLIETSGHSFSSKLRQDIVKSLMLLRGKQMIEDKVLYELFFKLFRMKDKKIRETVHKFIVNDVKRINLKSKNHAVNKSLQNFMYTMLQDQDVTASFKSLQVTEDLYRKNVWNDEKTVNVIAAACFHGHQKVKLCPFSSYISFYRKDSIACPQFLPRKRPEVGRPRLRRRRRP